MEILIKRTETDLKTQGAYRNAQEEQLSEMAAERKQFNEIVFGVTQDAADLFPAWKRANPTKHPEVRL